VSVSIAVTILKASSLFFVFSSRTFVNSASEVNNMKGGFIRHLITMQVSTSRINIYKAVRREEGMVTQMKDVIMKQGETGRKYIHRVRQSR
jgi:hypothetical protein